MSDYIVRATAAGLGIRAFAIDATETAEHARTVHGTTPVMTAALGRLLAAGAMMGSMMKGDQDLMSIQYRCDGPAQGMTVTADSKGNVKGYAVNPQVIIPLKSEEDHKLDVGGAVGKGTISVSRDIGLREPYSGQCEIWTGEIGDDLAYFFTTSDQVPSAVGLGVMVDTDCSVRHAGGFIIQRMPDASEEAIARLEARLGAVGSVTAMMDRGMSPEQILEDILGGFDLEIIDKMPARFKCDCSKDRISRALATISTRDLREIINDGEEIEVKCHFCNSAYVFGIDELEAIMAGREN